jgi:hypothetical protein
MLPRPNRKFNCYESLIVCNLGQAKIQWVWMSEFGTNRKTVDCQILKVLVSKLSSYLGSGCNFKNKGLNKEDYECLYVFVLCKKHFFVTSPKLKS